MMFAARSSWLFSDLFQKPTSAASHRISTFLLFLALTFWPTSLSSSGRLVVLWDRGRPAQMTKKTIMTTAMSELRQLLFCEAVELTVFWKDFLELIIVRAEAGQAFHVDDVLQWRVSKPADKFIWVMCSIEMYKWPVFLIDRGLQPLMPFGPVFYWPNPARVTKFHLII